MGRRRLALLALCLLAAVVVSVPRQRAGAVVGGEPADPGEWPWQVAVLQDGFVVCGGALIALDVVVTAAHCTDGSAPSDLAIEVGAVRAGEGQRMAVASIAQHEAYDRDTTRNDISLLHLVRPVVAGDLVAPIAIADPGTAALLVDRGDPVVVTGFGATTEDGDVSPILMEAEIEALDDPTCTSRYREDGDSVFGESQVCAGLDAGRVDACFGDSGGPLVAPADDERTTWFLVGLVSWGAGCGRPLRPTVYTEVAAYAGWLADQGAFGALDAARFSSGDDDPVLRLPAAGVTRGKASRYPWVVEVTGFDGPVESVAVELRGLSHDRPGDLDVWLEAPDGTVVTLVSDVGGAAVEGVDVFVVEGAPAGVDGGLAVHLAPTDLEPDRQRKGGVPPASLAALAGVAAEGEWRLLVADDRSGATGTLEGWALVLG